MIARGIVGGAVIGIVVWATLVSYFLLHPTEGKHLKWGVVLRDLAQFVVVGGVVGGVASAAVALVNWVVA